MDISRDKKKELTAGYKLRSTTGGVYRIVNRENGRYWLKSDFDLASYRNRFQFSQKIGACVHVKLQRDWATFGQAAFELEILEEIEQKPEETREQFKGRLKKLEEHWAEQYDPGQSY